MRVLNPRLGELVDRLTILCLKIEVGTATGVPTSHWVGERAEVEDAMQPLLNVRPAKDLLRIVRAAVGLASVNTKLWDAEDRLRLLRQIDPVDSSGLQEAAAVAFRIQALNDTRATLVTLLNDLQAGATTPAEKL